MRYLCTGSMITWNLTFNELIFSDSRNLRAGRHLIFWSVLVVGFYIQSLMPVENATMAALMSVCCFFPSCILCAYTLVYLFLPYFFERRKYFLFIAGFLGLCVVCMILNFYTSILFYRLTCDCEDPQMPLYATIGLGFVNTTHALTIGGLAFGIKIGKEWQQKQKENLLLTRQKISNELRFQKSLLHPQFLFNSLSTLHAKILSGAQDSPEVLVKLSDLLSYTLYEGMEQQVSLEKELTMLQTFLDLEMINRDDSFEATMMIIGKPENKNINPLLLLSLLQSCLVATGKEEPVRYVIHIEIEPEISSLRFHLVLENITGSHGRGKAWEKIVSTIHERMAPFPRESFQLRTDPEIYALKLEVFLAQSSPGSVSHFQNEKASAYENS